MKKNLFLFISFVFLGIVQTIIFMIAYARLFEPYSIPQQMLSLIYAVPQSAMVAAWVMVPVFFASFLYVFIRGEWFRKFIVRYVTTVIVALVFFCSLGLVLYGLWGWPLDVTPFQFFIDSPLQAIRLSPWWTFFVALALMIIIGWIARGIVSYCYPKRRSGSINRMSTGSAQQKEAFGNLLLIALSIIVGTGCFGLMGINSSYFTELMPLNHAATSPVYSLAHSLRQQQVPFGQQYRFLSDKDCHEAMQELNSLPHQLQAQVLDSLQSDSLQSVAPLVQGSPNVLVLMLESFGANACHYLNPEVAEDVMPNVNRLMREGVAFTHFYANSFNGDRTLPALLSGYPAQPTYSVMNNVELSSKLSFFTHNLHNAGYTTEFIYGADTHFMHFTDYLQYAGFDGITDSSNFEKEQYESPRGMHDTFMFEYLHHRLTEEAAAASDTLAEYPAQPYFKVFYTNSSQIPYDVPTHRFEDPYLNSLAYADAQLGSFISGLKADSTIWNNLLIIALPDHANPHFPELLMRHEASGYHLPMFWTGGAVSAPRVVDTYCQQTDIAATLLSVLGIKYEASDYAFSHDIFSADAPHFAFYTWPDGFGFLTDSISYIQANHFDAHPLPGSDDPTGRAQRLGKAYLQTLYDDLSARK